VEVVGLPVDGRSGGGLFSPEGFLIGVCNAADPADNEGIFAALPTIHRQLDLIGQRRIYEPSVPLLVASERGATREAPPLLPARPPVEEHPFVGEGTAAPGAAVLGESGGPSGPEGALPRPDQAADAEVICIIRSRSDPLGRSRIVVLEGPSAELLDRLDQESRRRAPAALAASTDGGRAAAAVASNPARRGLNRGPVVRGQSVDK
jgi:hypothetical protein